MNRARNFGLVASTDAKDLLRRPLILVLLVLTPVMFITRAIANTEPLPRRISVSGGTTLVTTMRAVHGADMVLITVAFLAGLTGVFVVGAVRQADGRLARAGVGARTVVTGRLAVLAGCTLTIVIVSLVVTGRSFTPAAWAPFALATAIVALTYACLGALAGAGLGRIGATYVILFAAMLDLGVVQNPMFGDGSPPWWARLLPGYPGTRAAMDAAFTHQFPTTALMGATGWLVLLFALALISLLRQMYPHA